MAYQATILNVMIASPSDVAEERQLVRDAIYEWNAIHSKRFKVMLNPIGWENNIAPQMGSHPQEIINKSILNDSDILIGIFWTRLGSPTGEYASGTVEEISKHCNTNKLASVYISKKPYPEDINLEQLQFLRNQTQIWLNEGLLDFYDNHSTFKQKIKDHLSLHIQHNEYIQAILNELNSNVTSIPASTKQTIKPSDEMVQILLSAGNAESDIHFRRYLGGQSLSAGDLEPNLNKPRELAKWENALNDLKNLGLIQDRGYEGECFYLTNEGWQAFDQLKEQQLENK